MKYLKTFENYTDSQIYKAYEEFDELVRDELHKQITDYEKGNKKQKWNLIEPNLLRNLFLRPILRNVDEKQIDKIVEILKENIVRLYVNTIMSGHSIEKPNDFLENNFYYKFKQEPEQKEDELEFTEEEFDEFTDDYYFKKDWGQWAISDYAMEPLLKLMKDLMIEKSYENMLPIISKILNITHMRGDIASLFVKGGSESLDWLEESEEEVNAT